MFSTIKPARALALISAMVFIVINSVPAQAASPLSLADIYSTSKVTKVYLDVPAASEASLNNMSTLENYVTAKVRFVQGSRESEQVSVGLRVKGTTSVQPLKFKPSLKIKFNWGSALKGQRFLGLKNMTLNSLSQDNSWIHEFASYKLYNSMGVIAPATGWAEVFVNNVPKGIYVNVETPDDIFLGKRFKDSTQHLYEGQAWHDLKPGNDTGDAKTGAFTVDEGWSSTPNKSDLTLLIKAANVEPLKSWYDGLPKYLDRTSMIKMFAVDNLIGNWDSYSGPIVNNYFLRSNSSNKFTFIPWGADQNFGEDRKTPEEFDTYNFAMDKPAVGFPWIEFVNKDKDELDRGLLFRKCLEYKPCFVQYLKELKNASAKVTSTKLLKSMATVSDLLDPWSNQGVREEQKRTIKFLANQQKLVSGLISKNKIK